MNGVFALILVRVFFLVLFLGGWATLTTKYNAGLFFNIDRNNLGGAPFLALFEKWPATPPTPESPPLARCAIDLHLENLLRGSHFLPI